jgi:uncharacterized protein YuzE
MKVKYFQGTDTLYIEFRRADVTETRDLDENTLLDLDAEGQLCAMTIEHAKDRVGSPAFLTSRSRIVANSALAHTIHPPPVTLTAKPVM